MAGEDDVPFPIDKERPRDGADAILLSYYRFPVPGIVEYQEAIASLAHEIQGLFTLAFDVDAYDLKAS